MKDRDIYVLVFLGVLAILCISGFIVILDMSRSSQALPNASTASESSRQGGSSTTDHNRPHEATNDTLRKPPVARATIENQRRIDRKAMTASIQGMRSVNSLFTNSYEYEELNFDMDTADVYSGSHWQIVIMSSKHDESVREIVVRCEHRLINKYIKRLLGESCKEIIEHVSRMQRMSFDSTKFCNVGDICSSGRGDVWYNATLESSDLWALTVLP